MRRSVSLLITILLFSLSVMSEGIDRTTALKRAQAFMPGKQFVTGKKYVILGHLSARKVRTEACGYSLPRGNAEAEKLHFYLAMNNKIANFAAE